MRAIDQMPAAEARGLTGLLFDLDDTFFTHGVLTREAYGALWKLRDAGLKLVAVTGRPHAWGEFVVRQWPVDGAVTENGALSVRREGNSLSRFDSVGDSERRSRRIRLASLVEAVREAVPEARLSDDVDGRVSDVTWDIGERMQLPEDRIRVIRKMIFDAGARNFRSSVHLHATFDPVDKAEGTVRFLVASLGEDSGSALTRYAYIGDSGNDAPCFAAFATTIGVSNVRHHLSRMSVPPQYVTSGPRGEGFREAAERILLLRS